MQPIAAIAMLTWRAAFRFRLFLVVSGLLVLAVIGLPLLLKDDGTARGFTQILLTYTLTVITALLGLSTLWLACGTLARDVEECQMQMVVVKPVYRWQIWLGKWLGIVTLDAALLALTGACVYSLLLWRASHLPPEQQTILAREVLVSRGSARPENRLAEINAEADRLVRERMEKNPTPGVNVAEVRKQILESLKSDLQIVPSGAYRWWNIDLSHVANSIKDQPLQLRIKFNAARRSPSGTFQGLWQVGVPDTPRLWRSEPMSLAPDTFHEIEIPAGLIGEDGVLTVVFLNLNDTALLFPVEDGMEVLYPQGGFLLNYIRALAVILCWMALLASIGLAASSFLSFPVASLVSVGLLILTFSSGTIALVADEGSLMGLDESTRFVGWQVVDTVMVPVFKGLLGLIRLARDFSPIDAVSTGRAIPWSTVAVAAFRVVFLLGGCFAALGMWLFTRREMATAQGNH